MSWMCTTQVIPLEKHPCIGPIEMESPFGGHAEDLEICVGSG